MQSYKFDAIPRLSASLKLRVLLLVWTFALVFGVRVGADFSAGHNSWMRQALESPVSIVGPIMCSVLPVLLTAAVAWLGASRLIYFLSGWKGFCLGFSALVCLESLGRAAWLVRVLFFFSQSLCLCLLWFLWLRLCKGKSGISVCGMILLLALCSGVACADYFYIAPFLGQFL